MGPCSCTRLHTLHTTISQHHAIAAQSFRYQQHKDAKNIDFRDVTLLDNYICFEEYGFATPEHVSQVIALLNHWPLSPSSERTQPTQVPAIPLALPNPLDEETELQEASDLAEELTNEDITAAATLAESYWLTEINMVLFGPLRKAAKPRLGQLSSSHLVDWTEGGSGADRLPNPARDFAIGLARSHDQDSPISAKGL